MSGLLLTKLHRPSLPPKRVQRPHLIQRLHEGLESGRKITLVSAPAGFGKTTCVNEWVHALDVPVAWLSLDPADDDPGRFFAYFIAALQKVDGSLGREIEGVLRSGQLPPIEVISTALSNDIQDFVGRFLLVLDDFHVIQDRFILQVLEKLVTSLPEPLHPVLLTREDPSLPLARLRANNQLTEIRAGDLRFTDQETERYLQEVMGLSLSEADTAALTDRTEGWIAGLQLAGLSVRGRENPSGFIAGLSGSHRFILSYLTEEVLDRQPEEIQHFLLQTSILDRLNGDLCKTVTERADSAILLEKLFAANLFLIPLDDERQWYRYHHLFADLLRDQQGRLPNELVARLHQRASQWYENAGMANEAIGHALSALDYAHAVQLIEEHAMPVNLQGYVKTVEGWMRALPPEWMPKSPKANLSFAWMHMLRGTYADASPYLERLQTFFADPNPQAQLVTGLKPIPASLKADWLALQSMLLCVQGKAMEGLDLANQALAIVPTEDYYLQSLIYVGLASAYRLLDDYAHARDAYQMAILHGREAGNFVSEMLSLSHLALMAIQHGQIHFAFEIASQGIERAERLDAPPPIAAAVYGALGQVYYHWHQLEQARGYIRREIQLSSLSGHNASAVSCRAAFSRLLQAEGDLDAAAREIQQAVDLMRLGVPAWIRPEAVSQQVRLYLAQNRLTEAEAALIQQGFTLRDGSPLPAPAPDRSITHQVGLLYNSTLRILLYRAQTRREPSSLQPGIELADQLISGALRGGYILVALETLLLRAKMHAALGNDRASRADHARALELAEPEGFISIFIEEGAPMSSPAPVSADIRPAGNQQLAPRNLLEPLTDRELDVLRLMAEGLKYEEIATRLFISLNTVRSHVRVVYGKLNANNRTKAIETARRLRLL